MVSVLGAEDETSLAAFSLATAMQGNVRSRSLRADTASEMDKNLTAAGEKGKGAGRALAALGIDFNSFIKLKLEEEMLAIAKAMDNFADGNGKVAVAQALWGKEGAKNRVFMKDLATAGDIQAKMTSEQAEESKNLTENWIRARSSGEAWEKVLAGGMTPALNIAANCGDSLRFVDSHHGDLLAFASWSLAQSAK